MPYKRVQKRKRKSLGWNCLWWRYNQTPFLPTSQQEIELYSKLRQSKAWILRSNVSKYVDQTIDDEKIPMNTAYAMINLSLAVELMDSKRAYLHSSLTLRWWDSWKLTDVAKFDYTEMWMDRIAVQWGLDRRMFWAEIRAKIGWNDMWMHPTIALKAFQLSWLPDPFFDSPCSFHYFERAYPSWNAKRRVWI